VCVRMNLTIVYRNGQQVTYKNPECVRVMCHTPFNKGERCMDVQVDKELICDVNLVTMNNEPCNCLCNELSQVPFLEWTDEEVLNHLKNRRTIPLI